ncbi:GGDEF domain-containing protein [Desulfuribacillus alkaliarsenatis]|uniref:GGDEF domain-containing protein n=1 Tax=Desulfuribacillus alkaliarsenatis TaxID=766136 RepID=A0A1E5G4N0_9FIRM|nr:GGDEF domain-containing protein [Desulfuribacillus alkaliarsenatis]OEF98140.1 hypothetical protein BHF68_00150 [Desulfuribacillus alkaliarsenatis]
MVSTLNKGYALIFAVIIVPIILGFVSSQYSDVIINAPLFHYYYIALSCVASFIVGIFAYREYSRTGDFKVYLLSIGFIGITILYGFHGLITPGKSICSFESGTDHINAFVFFGDISRFWIGMFMFFQVMSYRNVEYRFNKLLLLSVVAIILVLLSIAILYFPDVFPDIKSADGKDTHFAILIKVITLVLLGVAATRYYDSYRILQNPPILTLIVASILIMQTVVLFMISTPWGLLWWLAHNLYLLSFISVGIGLFISYKDKYRFEFFNIHRQIQNYIEQLNGQQQELYDTNQKLNELATKDPLTGLPNRNYLHYYVNHTIKELRQTKDSIAILFIDLDGFKNINDNYGHDTGDKLLKKISEILQECVRNKDLAVRLGGDEFLLVLHEVDNKELVGDIAKRVLMSITNPHVIGEHTCKVGASIGISQYPEDGDQFGILIRRADAAMYWVKEHGKNNFAFYTDIQKHLKESNNKNKAYD